MKNAPNMYRVNYLVVEGDNYAGGWGKRSADVEALGDVARFSNVESVEPIFIEIGDPVSDIDIQEAVNERRQQDRDERKREEVRRAEEQLQRAKAALNT